MASSSFSFVTNALTALLPRSIAAEDERRINSRLEVANRVGETDGGWRRMGPWRSAARLASLRGAQARQGDAVTGPASGIQDTTGRATVNRDPSPTWLWTSIRPRWASAIHLQI